MCRLFLLLILALVIGVMALAGVALKEWGCTGFVGVLAGILVGLWTLKRVAGFAFRTAFMAPFKAKGAVLRGARATVHSIAAAEQPARRYDPEETELEDGDDTSSLPRWYRIDVTITPTAQLTPFSLWEPAELQLVSGEKEPDADSGPEIEEVRIWQHGAFTDDEVGKYPGPQRLELLVGVPEDVDVFRFSYYFERFGEVRLPA